MSRRIEWRPGGSPRPAGEVAFKLDENVAPGVAQVFRQAGYDPETVADERLVDAGDPEIARVCRGERRCLVTLDLDFANILSYPPSEYAGIIVLRLPSARIQLQRELARAVAREVETAPIATRLWIVEPGRIGVHES